MHDPIETAAARMAALERENAVIRANNAKLQAEVDRLRELSSGERSELHGLRTLVAEINEALGLNPAEPADARTTLDVARARGQSGTPVGDTARKLATPEPPPRAGHTAVLPVALAFLQERAAQGRAKYGRELDAGNGRDALADAVQEAGDQFQYLVQLWLERQHEESELARLTTLRPLNEWTEDDGDVLWWNVPVNEPPWVGHAGEGDWHFYTHWTPLPKVQP